MTTTSQQQALSASEEKHQLSLNMSPQPGQEQNHAASPAATFLVAQSGGYYPLYNQPSELPVPAKRPCCNGAFEPAKQTAKYDDTDLCSLRPNVNVDFSETFQESPGSESIDIVWRFNKTIYSVTSRAFYTFLVGLLGPTLAVAWGLVFATLNFTMVWLVNPFLKVIFQVTRLVEILSRIMVRSTLDPLFQSFGQVFTALKGNFSLNLAGLEALNTPKGTSSNSISARVPPYSSSDSNV
ncbi:caveolin-1-like [Diadema setosum]|uniref:caveolin-1-like n=1 Tax=Diadema setosum TaxID=31175 RepID=UPI003B3A5FE1